MADWGPLTPTDWGHVRQSGSSFTKQAWSWYIQHTSTNNAWTTAHRFLIPDDVDIGGLTSVTMDVVSANSGSWNVSITCAPDTPAISAGIHSEAVSAMGTYGAQTWDQTVTSSSGDTFTTPSFSGQMAAALAAGTASGGFYDITVYVVGAIGPPRGAQIAMPSHGSLAGPALTLVADAPPNWQSEQVGITVDPTVDALGIDEDIAFYGVSALGTTDHAVQRILDVYPARDGSDIGGAWNTVIFIHGGAWAEGSHKMTHHENGVWRPLIEKLVDTGYNVVSINYRLSWPQLFENQYVKTWPMPLQDVRAGMTWLGAHLASDYHGHNQRVIISGHSAGGHMAAFAALSAIREDSTDYTGYRPSVGYRAAGYGHSDSANPWLFDFVDHGELDHSIKPAGILVHDSPSDMFKLWANAQNPGAEALAGGVRKMCMGVSSGAGSPPGAAWDEMNWSDYIGGTGTNSYTTAMSPLDVPPIFFIYSTTEDIVANAASIIPLETALDDIGYDTSTAVGVLNTSGGLTKHETDEIHSNTIRSRAPWTEEFDWLDEVFSSITLPQTVTIGSGIGSGEAFGTPTLSSGATTINAGSVDSAEAFGVPEILVVGGPQTVSFTDGIASAEAVPNPLLDTGSLGVTPGSIGSAEQFGIPELFVEQAISVSSGIASQEGLGQPVLSGESGQFLTVVGISTEEMFGPTVVVVEVTPVEPATWWEEVQELALSGEGTGSLLSRTVRSRLRFLGRDIEDDD